MLNRYPLWKNILILVAIGLGVVYALPNLYPDDYALQISGSRSSTIIDDQIVKRAERALDSAGIAYRDAEVADKNAMLRFDSGDDQLAAKPIIQAALGDNYIAALNLAPTTPDWLTSMGAGPMKLGLDLRGGVHFLLEVDMEKALTQRLDVYASEIKTKLREEKIRYRGVSVEGDLSLLLKFSKDEERSKATSLIKSEYLEFQRRDDDEGNYYYIYLTLSEAKIKEIEDYAVKQNLTTLRNRVNELGVAEPLVQRQGRNRIVVELPGVQDTVAAKRILGATANLEFRLEAKPDAGRATSDEFEFRSNPSRTALLERDVIVTGNSVSNASATFDENGTPQVNITLDSTGGSMMGRVTRNSIKRRMAVVFIEQKGKTIKRMVDGVEVIERKNKEVRSIISLATIQSAFGASFRITGLDSVAESSELALLLRAGSLAAPMYFVEERTVGPSLGQQNIDAGVLSVQLGFGLVLLFMLVYYRVFGVVANIALAVNMVLLLAFMSILSATLTLPGIAGIVLTVGMAVDANVLIFARIREELANGLPAQSAIHAGYSRAFVTIFDANITTLLVALILFAVGTGPVKGFAVTLSIGILTSMFTAIVVTRAIVNLIYGNRNVKTLSI
ncbi:protein translocase subunit SecD [Alkalimarinus alittae]|uniref:Protein translocase subunit SecD n=1 Tax=Alkalimarinus alittae TaxID=2961619 RepID=A0ABY6N6G1_9ALTE|nr:protein translocase subunit SecD [Alkalimarinus alittae]UZE97703.1 protein translocase subunit SecD [Alkalimarinus alittae]